MTMSDAHRATAILGRIVSADPTSCSLDEAVDANHWLRAVRGFLDGFEAKLAIRLNELHEQGVGAPASEMFVRGQRLSAKEARARDRRAKALDEAPSFGDALVQGSVSAVHADVLASATCQLDDEHKALFLAHEGELVAEAKHSTPENFGRLCRGLADRISKDHGLSRDERNRRNTSARRSVQQSSGMHRIVADFHPELGYRVFTAIDDKMATLTAARREAGEATENIDRDRLAAEALGELICGGHQTLRPPRTEIAVTIDLHTLKSGLHERGVCELANGVELSPESIRRLACEAHIIPVVLGGDHVPLDVGRNRRLATREQRVAIRTMYHACAFDGCDTPFVSCEVHHVIEWDALGGETDLDNLLPLCSRHHHLVHEGRWRLQLKADRTLTILRPDGEIHAVCGTDRDPRDEREHRRRTGHLSGSSALAA